VRYVLDTNTVSALMRGDPALVERLTSEARSDVLLPQPVVAEIAYGLARMKSSARKGRLERRFRIIMEELARVPWNDEVSRYFGTIRSALERAGARLEDFDVAIAAHALAHQATLVSADHKHMARIRGLRVESWL
jgi:tRNA(fMet)-specific endonuclease VapC